MFLNRLTALCSLSLVVGACSASTSSSAPNDGKLGTAGASGSNNGGVAAANGAGTGAAGSVGPIVSNSGGAQDLGNIQTIDPTSMKCAAIANKGEQITVDIFIMFDQSLSMTCTVPAGGDRWDAVKGPLESFVQDPKAAGINVGIGYFGNSIFSSCNASDYQKPEVEIGPLPMNAMPIVSSLNAHMPVSNTPTPAAMVGAINHAIDWKNTHPGHTVVVVLVTDGEPNACGAVADVVNAAQQGFRNTIPTYVIGVTSPGTTCMLDPNPPNQMDLDAVAAAGGTMHALLVDVTQNAAQQFVDTMNQIRAKSQVPCQYALPKAMPGTQLDPNKVNVQFIPAGAPMGTTVLGVTMNTCDPVNGGWYYDNPNAPTKINLCPATCMQATTQTGSQIDITVGCATQHPA